MPLSATQQTIYAAGAAAGVADRDRSQPVTACPHRTLSNDWQLWQGGYWTALTGETDLLGVTVTSVPLGR